MNRRDSHARAKTDTANGDSRRNGRRETNGAGENRPACACGRTFATWAARDAHVREAIPPCAARRRFAP